MRLKKIFISIILFIAITDCSNVKTHWEHSSTSRDQWLIDEADCATKAKILIQKNLESLSYIQTIEPRISDAQLSNALNAHAAKKMREKLFHTCLRRLGYTPVKQK